MKSKPLESRLEQYLILRVKVNGGRACKFVSPGLAGVQDRIVLKPGGKVIFVEMKRLGEEPRPLQKKRRREFEAMGFKVYVLDSKAAVDQFIKEEFERG